MRVSAVVLSVCMALTVATGAAKSSELPIDATCVVMDAGNAIANSLVTQMHSEVTHDMHAIMNIFDMSCLRNIINFGNLGWFGLSGFLDGLQGKLCNAVKDWLTATAGDPSHADLNRALAQITAGRPPTTPVERSQKAQGVTQ